MLGVDHLPQYLRLARELAWHCGVDDRVACAVSAQQRGLPAAGRAQDLDLRKLFGVGAAAGTQRLALPAAAL